MMEKTKYPLVERNVGTITYEHTVVENLCGDIYVGDAERNYYVDRHHEINLCAHFNVRKLGTMQFLPEYHFYVTDGRMSLALHWSLGVPNEEMVLERYQSLEEAKVSKYYEDFVELKTKIDEEILRQKTLTKNWQYGESCSSCKQNSEGEDCCELTEFVIGNGKEFVQVHHDILNERWKISKSTESVMTLWRYLNDFEQLNENELHLMNYVMMEGDGTRSDSPYYKFLEKAKKDYQHMQNIEWKNFE